MQNLIDSIKENHKLEEEARKSYKKLCANYLNSLRDYYKNWRATKGDKCVLLNLGYYPITAQILIVQYADNGYISASKSAESRVSHSIDLEKNFTEIREAKMLVPYSYFNDLSKLINIELYD